MKNGIHEVSGTVSREGSAGAVGSMSTGSQPKDKNARPRVTEPGYRTGPVDLIPVGPTAGLANTSAIGTKAVATLAGYDGLLDTEKIGRKGSGSGASHSNHDIRLVHRLTAQHLLDGFHRIMSGSLNLFYRWGFGRSKIESDVSAAGGRAAE
jgi:hypothetical protein